MKNLKVIVAFVMGVVSGVAVPSFAQFNGEMTIPSVSVVDFVTNKELLYCRYVMHMLNGHQIMCRQ